MRNAFADELVQIGKENKEVIMLSADIGNRLFDPFKKLYPNRFFNCGVAEANTIGVAAGLAMSGFRPIAYTITPFITYRCLEQIRIDLCYHNLPVIIVGVGSGLSYASLGPTHHSCEDIAVLRSFPNMTILCPADANEARAALKEALKQKGPVYIRLGKKNEPLIHKTVPELKIGKPLVIKEGKNVCILSCGTILPEAIKAANILKEKGISVKVVSFHTVKPLNTAFLKKEFCDFDLVVSVEEHSLIGGFGSAVSEYYSQNSKEFKSDFISFGTKDEFLDIVKKQDSARKFFEIDAESIADKISKKLDR